jgi:N-acetylglutamate synthase-like GNAT family acetyltransferase
MPVKIRRLRSSDLDDVLEISRHVWEGHDYVPLVFEQWLKDKSSYFFGVEVDGRVVAVANLHVIENKRTGWMEGLRVHPDFRGRGYASDLTRFLVQKGEDSGVDRLRYTTGENNAASLKLASNAGFSRLLDKAVFWCVKPKRAPPVRGYSPVEEAEPKRAYELLKSKPRLVPHGVLIFDWRAVDSTLENFEEIGRTHGFFVAVKDGRLDSMSFGRLREGLEKTWGLTVYASDPMGFRAHLSFNVKRALEERADTVMCTYDRLYEGTLSQVSFGCEDQDAEHLVLLEKQIRKVKRLSAEL